MHSKTKKRYSQKVSTALSLFLINKDLIFVVHAKERIKIVGSVHTIEID